MVKVPRTSRNPKLVEETEEIVEDYTVDYSDKASGQKYLPIAAYVGIIFAIILGAIIIAFSIVISSGKVPGFGFLNSNSSPLANNVVSESPAPPAFVDIKTSPDYAVMGSPDAPVTVIEFADFQCPFCKEFQDKVFAQLKSKYVDTGIVKFYFLHFPFIGQESEDAAIAAECARQQNKFWPYHDLLYVTQGDENSNAFSDTVLKKLAKQAGLNAAKFATCQSDKKTAATVADQFQVGQDAQVDATPTLFINGKRNSGSGTFAGYQRAIEEARKAK